MDDLNETKATTTQEEENKPRTGPESVRLWHERVSLAKQATEDWSRKEGADRVTQEYNGKFELFFNGLKGKIPVPPINEIFAYVQADVAGTYNRDPYLSVNPKAGTPQGAKLWEVILNYYWRHLRNKDEIELEIIDKDLAGYGFHKVGYEVESEGAEEDLKIIHEGLYSKRVEWKDIVWNFGAEKPPYDCLWMAQRIVKPLEIVKKKYPAAKKLQGTQNPEVDKNAYDKATYKDDISVAVLWEVWDKQTRHVYLIAEGLNDKYLEKPRPWPEYVDEFPFLMYWDFYAPTKRRPMSAIIPWEPQIHEKMVLMAAAVNHAKRWNRQMLLKKGTVSDNDLDKIERGDDGAIIDYTGTGNLAENSKMLEWGNMPTDYYLLMDRLAAIQRDVNGQPEFERGGVTKTTSRTEGELQMIQAGAKGRQDRKIDRFESHLENIARHMMAHLKANFDFEETVRITGEPPEAVIQALGEHFDPLTGNVKFTPQDIEGDYEVEVKAGSTLPLNRETKKQVLQMVLMTLSKFEGPMTPPLIKAIVSEILREYDMKSLEEAYAQELQMFAGEKQKKDQEGNALEAKAKTQAQKNVAQAGKVQVDTQAQQIENELTVAAAKQQMAMMGAMGNGGM
jgi:hypothetical protein